MTLKDKEEAYEIGAGLSKLLEGKSMPVSLTCLSIFLIDILKQSDKSIESYCEKLKGIKKMYDKIDEGMK